MPDQNLRHQLDGPMRKVREELGLRPLEEAGTLKDDVVMCVAQGGISINDGRRILDLFKHGVISRDEVTGYFKAAHMGTANAHKISTQTESTGPR